MTEEADTAAREVKAAVADLGYDRTPLPRYNRRRHGIVLQGYPLKWSVFGLV